jgi:hypothetical protein
LFWVVPERDVCCVQDPVKADAGHVQVEKYLNEAGFSSGAAFFRPQYITGKYNNKDCEEWFFDSEHLARPADNRYASWC